jgi:hypothetical protein
MQYVSNCRNWRKTIKCAVRELTLSEQCDEDVILLHRWGSRLRYSEGSQCLRLQSQSARDDLLLLELLDAKLLDPKREDTSETLDFIYLRTHCNIPEDMHL